jgi:serine/threonine protein kinase
LDRKLYEGWEVIKELGQGGQSDVFLVRNPERVQDREMSVLLMPLITDFAQAGAAAEAMFSYARPDDPSWLGALKVFKIRGSEEQAVNRLKQEAQVLRQNRVGLPKLLDFSEKERWIVTEYFPRKTLEHQPGMYRGKVKLALKAFLSLVETVAALHKENIIHRDIKPSNVFVRDDETLVLGDFGIVLLPDQRHTHTSENVGPRHYIPPWADVGGRLEKVEPNFDVYMLGKLLWCMVSGKLHLSRESFNEPDNDLTQMFGGDPHMFIVNDILSKCLVDKPNKCVPTDDLRIIVKTYVHVLDQGGQLLREGVPRPCHICGLGNYRLADLSTDDSAGLITLGHAGKPVSERSVLKVHVYYCDYCRHVEFFLEGLSAR